MHESVRWPATRKPQPVGRRHRPKRWEGDRDGQSEGWRRPRPTQRVSPRWSWLPVSEPRGCRAGGLAARRGGQMGHPVMVVPWSAQPNSSTTCLWKRGPREHTCSHRATGSHPLTATHPDTNPRRRPSPQGRGAGRSGEAGRVLNPGALLPRAGEVAGGGRRRALTGRTPSACRWPPGRPSSPAAAG